MLKKSKGKWFWWFGFVHLKCPSIPKYSLSTSNQVHPTGRTSLRFRFGSDDLWCHLGRIWTPNIAKTFFLSCSVWVWSFNSLNRHISFKYSWNMGVQVVLDNVITFLSPTVAPAAVGSCVCWLRNKIKLITFPLECNYLLLSWCSLLHAETFLPAK